MSIDDTYHQVIRCNDMHAYDNLPAEVRTWLQINDSNMRCEMILFHHRVTFENNVDKTLKMLQG